MVCVYKRRKQYWISYYVNGQQIRQSLHTTNERVALARKKRIEYELSLGDLQMASQLPLVPVLEAFCKYLESTRTFKSFKNDFSRLRAFFGPICQSLESCPPGVKRGQQTMKTVKDMVAVYIYAGLRCEEALWLTPDDVDRRTQDRTDPTADRGWRCAYLADIRDHERLWRLLADVFTSVVDLDWQQMIEEYRRFKQVEGLQEASIYEAMLTLGHFRRLAGRQSSRSVTQNAGPVHPGPRARNREEYSQQGHTQSERLSQLGRQESFRGCRLGGQEGQGSSEACGCALATAGSGPTHGNFEVSNSTAESIAGGDDWSSTRRYRGDSHW